MQRILIWGALVLTGPSDPAAPGARPQQGGSIRGIVYDKDFEAPLAAARVLNVETGQSALTSEQGNYLLERVLPGRYTLVFSKEGYVRQIRSDVVVTAGQLTEIDAWLPGEITEMEEFVVQDILQLGGATETGLLQLRFESLSLIDSIGSDLMSKAGVSDAAGALKLVAGASVQDGKSAVIRGLPDRYVSSQMNSVRLPSADEDKRAVELDQFPAAVIESVQVSKTFTPDQQGDASGGAVNVRLRGIPEETLLRFKSQIGYNTSVAGSDFLTYQGGGLSTFGRDDPERGIQFDNLGDNWDGAVGIARGDAPVDYKWGLDAGTRHEFSNGVLVGGLASFFYERDSSFYDDGIDDSLWVVNPGEALSPEYSQGAPDGGGGGDYRTALFDVTQGSESEQWGFLGTFGLETERDTLALTYLYTHGAEDTATLAEDTRGKEFFFPGYDPDDGSHPGNQELSAAPYIRTETLEYTERTSETLQLHGHHDLPAPSFRLGSVFDLGPPELDWTVSRNRAAQDQPDKRSFAAVWFPVSGGLWVPFKPSATFLLGNLQRTWKEIEEEGEQVSLGLRLPFEQWNGHEGSLGLGRFDDSVERSYDQDSFSNFNDVNPGFVGEFEDFWSEAFPLEDHPITDGPPFTDVDYEGSQDVSAWYAMLDLPLTSSLSVIGGARFESTEIDVVNFAEADATWFPQGVSSPVDLLPGEADVAFDQDDLLPALGLVLKPSDELTVRGSYSETVARQTFRELVPILQQDYLGAPVFIGNPELGMSSLKNFDLRVDYVPHPGGLVSVSWFDKQIEDPIEYVQRVATFVFTTARNYPEGALGGYEIELRQDLGRHSERLTGLSIGGNATFIDSEVTLPDDEALILEQHQAPEPTRDATQAPEYLYNLYLTYGDDLTGTQIGLFYTVQGDTLVAGAGALGGTTNYVPSVYAKEFGTLSFSWSRRLGEHVVLQFQAKNLTNPDIETVYRSAFIDGDTTKTSYSQGREFSLGLSVHL